MNLDMESGAEGPQSPAMRDCRAFMRGLEPREASGVRRFTAALGSWPLSSSTRNMSLTMCLIGAPLFARSVAAVSRRLLSLSWMVFGAVTMWAATARDCGPAALTVVAAQMRMNTGGICLLAEAFPPASGFSLAELRDLGVAAGLELGPVRRVGDGPAAEKEIHLGILEVMVFAVLASGNGSNLQAIINAAKKGKIKGTLKVVISDKADAKALARARKAGVKKVLFVNPKDFLSREDYDDELVAILKKEKVGLVVLAGFMRILSPVFIKAFRNKVINVHPALLPAFKGAHAVKDALAYGVKATGVTVHFVVEQVDHGAIIAQGAVEGHIDSRRSCVEEKSIRVDIARAVIDIAGPIHQPQIDGVLALVGHL